MLNQFGSVGSEATLYLPLAIIGVFVLRGVGSYISEYGLAWIGSRVVFDLLLFYLDLDEAAGPQYTQVPAHGRPAQRASGRQLTGPARTFSKQFHHLAPSGIGQGSERGVKISNHCFRFK